MPLAEKNFHIWTEALSVFLVAPFVFYAASGHPDPTVKLALNALGFTLIFVDGYLLTKYKEW